ncbi:Protein CBG26068 [Caenorhabditis briggsae]|uniref:Protein CBG26068 n=1 Tax=Caenorhabditis briggsae TaxID=6238 RepID=B6ILQ1_CAEBR|nr:Protein CBG26068 [Caenorhabditis briggsae]CAS00831.1 Protein CBG26068 [Caenorhabditis briggsae]
MYVPLAEDRERSAAQKLPRKKLKPQAVPQPSLFHNGSLDGSGPLKAIIQHVHPTLPSPQLNSQHFNHPGINFQDERLSQETPLNVSHKFLNNQYQQHFGYFMNQNPCPTGSSELQIPKTQSFNQVDLQNVNGHIQNSFQYDHKEPAEQLVQNPAYSDQQIQFNNRINQNFNAPLPAPLVSTAPTPILAPPLAPMQSPQLAQFLPKPYLPPPYPNLKIDAQEDPDVQIVDIKPSTHELQGLRDLKKKEIILEPRSSIVFCAPFDLNPVGRFRIRNLFWARVAYKIEDTIGTINAKSNKIIEISCEGFQYKPDAKDRIRISLTNAPEEDGNLTKEYFDGDVTIMKKSMFVEYRD